MNPFKYKLVFFCIAELLNNPFKIYIQGIKLEYNLTASFFMINHVPPRTEKHRETPQKSSHF